MARGEAFARRLISETDGQTAALIGRAWRLAIGRDPTDSEFSIARDFIDEQRTLYSGDAVNQSAIADFCQMLLASNAFLYVE